LAGDKALACKVHVSLWLYAPFFLPVPMGLVS
jgi:hypothetical protein